MNCPPCLRSLHALDRYVKAQPVGGPKTGSTAVAALISTVPSVPSDGTTLAADGTISTFGSNGEARSEGAAMAPYMHRIWVANVGDCRAVLVRLLDPYYITSYMNNFRDWTVSASLSHTHTHTYTRT